jgi:hypothetical protein
MNVTRTPSWSAESEWYIDRREQGFLSESTQSGLIWIDAVTSDAADQPMMGVFEYEASILEDRVAAPVWQVRTYPTMFYTNFLLLLNLGRRCQGRRHKAASE